MVEESAAELNGNKADFYTRSNAEKAEACARDAMAWAHQARQLASQVLPDIGVLGKQPNDIGARATAIATAASTLALLAHYYQVEVGNGYDDNLRGGGTIMFGGMYDDDE